MRQYPSISRFWLALLLITLCLLPVIPAQASTYSTVVLASGPEAYWRLGEFEGTTAVDASGHGHDATYTGELTLGASGAIQGDSDTGITCDGTNDNVVLPTLQFANRSFTVEFWMKPETRGVAQTPFNVLTAWETSQVFYSQLFDTGDLAFSVFNKYYLSVGEGAITFSAWNHVVFSYDDTIHTTIVYVNGVEAASNSRASPFTGADPYTTFGSISNYSDWFKGGLDELAIYWRPLTPAEVLQHYVTAGYSGSSPTSTPTATPTETPTPTPAPWALATMPGLGLTYQVSYEASAGDALIFVVLLLIATLGFVQTLIAIANRR